VWFVWCIGWPLSFLLAPNSGEQMVVFCGIATNFLQIINQLAFVKPIIMPRWPKMFSFAL
jgi:hypothetical protein